MMSNRIDREMTIIRFLANHGPKTGYEIKHHLDKELSSDISYGDIFADLRELRDGGLVVITETEEQSAPKLFGHGEEKGDARLFDIDRSQGGGKWRDKMEELRRAKERLGPEGEPGLGGLSPA